ncbi:MAG: hypothetical protein E6G97_18375 [Alphaproteobacteria bacterium]|nr:MAG: hypothetical protein E6G97_18375 [Alphaproteobacteria bacterium]
MKKFLTVLVAMSGIGGVLAMALARHIDEHDRKQHEAWVKGKAESDAKIARSLKAYDLLDKLKSLEAATAERDENEARHWTIDAAPGLWPSPDIAAYFAPDAVAERDNRERTRFAQYHEFGPYTGREAVRQPQLAVCGPLSGPRVMVFAGGQAAK